MGTVISVLQTALPVFLVLAVGMVCRKTGFLSREGIDNMKKVVLNITLPCVLFHAFAAAEYSLATVTLPLTVYLLCCLALVLGFGLGKLFKLPGRLTPFLSSGFEAGMLGYALFTLLYPDVSSSRFAILDLGQTLFVFTLYKILLSGEKNLKAIGKDMLTSPILWAVAAGVVLGATGLYGKLASLRGILDSVTDFISAPTATVILLAVGYEMVLREIPWKKTAGMVALRLVVMAVCFGLLLLLNRFVFGGMIFTGAALVMVILPPPYVIPVFADEPSERVQISSALSALTVVTVILFAVASVAISVIG